MAEVLSACTVAVSLMAIYMSIVTLRAERRQKRIDNLIVLYEFLHRQELSESRRIVREGECKPSLADQHVRNVCSSFDFAATLVRHGAVDTDLFLDYWCIPLSALDVQLSLIADDTTGLNVTVREYYKDLFWLIEQARSRRRTVAPAGRLTPPLEPTATAAPLP